MAKRYIRINFQNSPSVATPLNATNLNKIDKGIDDCDNAIEDLYNVKIAKADIIQTTAVNDATKVPSSVVTKTLANQIATLNDNLAVDKNCLSINTTHITLLSNNSYYRNGAWHISIYFITKAALASGTNLFTLQKNSVNTTHASRADLSAINLSTASANTGVFSEAGTSAFNVNGSTMVSGNAYVVSGMILE